MCTHIEGGNLLQRQALMIIAVKAPLNSPGAVGSHKCVKCACYNNYSMATGMVIKASSAAPWRQSAILYTELLWVMRTAIKGPGSLGGVASVAVTAAHDRMPRLLHYMRDLSLSAAADSVRPPKRSCCASPDAFCPPNVPSPSSCVLAGSSCSLCAQSSCLRWRLARRCTMPSQQSCCQTGQWTTLSYKEDN